MMFAGKQADHPGSWAASYSRAAWSIRVNAVCPGRGTVGKEMDEADLAGGNYTDADMRRLKRFRYTAGAVSVFAVVNEQHLVSQRAKVLGFSIPELRKADAQKATPQSAASEPGSPLRALQSAAHISHSPG